MTEKEQKAAQMFPGVAVGLGSVFDLPTAINTGEFLIDIPPTVYFKYNEDERYEYCLYCLFWYMDTVAPHYYDFTGWLECRSKTPDHPSYRLLRWHYRFEIWVGPAGLMSYTAGDHNPTSLIPGAQPIPDNYAVFRQPALVDMDCQEFWDYGHKEGSVICTDAVKPPWDWKDRHAGNAGQIWHDPAGFLDIMLKTYHK